MPLKFLPFLKLRRNKNPEPQKSSPNSEPGLIVENLISLNEVPASVVGKLYLLTIILIAIFVALTFINQAFKTTLDTLKQEQIKLVTELQGLEDKQAAILVLDEKIKFYQNYLQTKKQLTDKASFIMDHVNPNLIVMGGEVDNRGFKISLVGKNVYLFTQLIMQYLNGDLVREISITGADLDSSGQTFRVDLKGVFE